jgi:hypothetical protein
MDVRRCGAAALACLALAIGVVGCSSKDDGAAKDVKVTRCEADPSGGRPTASGSISNGSSKDSAYAFRVRFTDASGNRVSEGAVTVAKVHAGGDATWRATGVARAKGPLTCDLAGVTRTAVP